MKSPIIRVGIIDPEGILNGSKKTERNASTPRIIKDIDLNSPNNVVITCPNHHKMIDVHYPEFKKKLIVFEDGKKGLETIDGNVRLFLTLNEHL